jgi:hypothetical protein
MRSKVVLLLLLSLGLASPMVLRAQFQPPTKEELEMTSDPKAPGADAVYLYREEKTDDNLHYHSIYVRIKVLTEKGKELATVRTPYERRSFKVSGIQGRTIHRDGTIVPLAAKASDLTDLKTKDLQINTKVFTLPDVEVGSILEYRLEIRYDDDMLSSPRWEIQQPYFVHKAHYSFQPFAYMERVTTSHGQAANRLMWAVVGPKDTKVVENDLTHHYTFDISDVPATPTDDWMPPLNSLNWKVDFYYTPYTSGAEFWQKEGKRWGKEADHFAEPTNTLHEAAAKIVSPGDTDEQKARKLYDEVMKLDNTDFSREKSNAERMIEKLKQIRNAEDVWNQKSGSSDDIALLYVALARAAGLHVFPMQVVDRNRAIFDGSYLTLRQLDDYIAVLVLNGKDVHVDPGQKMCPFGVVHWKHALTAGLRLADSGPTVEVTPATDYTDSVIARVADITIDSSGGVKGTARFIMKGQQALHWRQLALKNDEEEVRKRFIESIRSDMPDGVQADFDHFLGLEDYKLNLVAIVNVSGNLGAFTGKRLFLPEMFFEAHTKHPFVAQDKRTVPIDVHYPSTERDEVTYRLPAEFTMETAPPPTDISWPKSALLKASADPKGNVVTVGRVAAFNFTLLAPEAYNDLHDFYRKVAAADQQQLVFTRGQVAKGN